MEKKHAIFILTGLLVIILAAYVFFLPGGGSGQVDGRKVVAAAGAILDAELAILCHHTSLAAAAFGTRM